MNGFEGSFLGDALRLDPTAALECGVCWWVYDPARGDDTWQIPAGTPFSELPAHWRCPHCDAAQEQFMVLRSSGSGRPAPERPVLSDTHRRQRRLHRRLLDAYSAAAVRMRGLPVYNEQLAVQVFGLQEWQEWTLGVVATPWCMNIVLIPAEGDSGRMEGTVRDVEFPSGTYGFVAGHLEGFGPLESCSLFSPMEQFDSAEVVAEVAGHVLRELLASPAPPPLNRRQFLRGRGQQSDDRHIA